MLNAVNILQNIEYFSSSSFLCYKIIFSNRSNDVEYESISRRMITTLHIQNDKIKTQWKIYAIIYHMNRKPRRWSRDQKLVKYILRIVFS